MLWVSIFIAGLAVLLAGVMPLILNGVNARGAAVTVVGILMVLAGGAGTMDRPAADSLVAGMLSFGRSSPPPAVATVDPAAATTDVGPKVRVIRTEPVGTPAPPKDESQLKPSQAPQPVPVQTTTVAGSGSGAEGDPLDAGTADTPPAAETTVTAPQPAIAPAPVPAPPPPAAPSEADILAGLTDQQSKQETAFIQAMAKGKQSYARADDSGRASAQSSRAAAVCAALGKPDVKGWVGAVKAVEKDSGGRLIVTLTLSDGTLVKTWNNAMSDADDKTLVESGTPLAANLESMKPADPVRFSGSFFLDDTDCVRSSRLGLDQSMMEPSYLFRFSAIEKL